MQWPIQSRWVQVLGTQLQDITTTTIRVLQNLQIKTYCLSNLVRLSTTPSKSQSEARKPQNLLLSALYFCVAQLSTPFFFLLPVAVFRCATNHPSAFHDTIQELRKRSRERTRIEISEHIQIPRRTSDSAHHHPMTIISGEKLWLRGCY